MAFLAARMTCPAVATSRMCSARLTSQRAAAPLRSLATSGVSSLKAFAMPARVSRGNCAAVVTRASSDVTYEIAPQGPKDYAPVLGVLAFVAAIQGRLDITAHLVLKSLATLQLLVAAAAVVTRRYDPDTVAAVVGPAVLAVAALNLEHITYLQAANALFGYYISEKLEIVAEGSFWVWVATLAGAIYAGYGLQWYTAAFALWQGTKLVRGSQDNKIPVLTIPAVLTAAWAFWKDHAQLFAVALFVAHTIASGLGLLEEVTDKHT